MTDLRPNCWFRQVLQLQRLDVAVFGEVNDHPGEYSIAAKLVDRLDRLLADIQFEAQPYEGVVRFDLVLLIVARLFLLFEYLVIEWMVGCELLFDLSPFRVLADFRDVFVGVDFEGNPVVLVQIYVLGVGSAPEVSNEH